MAVECLEARQLLYAPNDPYFDNDFNNPTDSYQWYFGRFDSPGIGTPKGINLEAAWDELIIGDGFTRSQLPLPLDQVRNFGLGDPENPTGDPTIPPYFVIQIVDDGIQLDHPDLGLNQGRWYAPTSCEVVTSPQCPGDGSYQAPFIDQHGTAVAGLAIASRDNDTGIVGVAPDAYWSSLRLLPNDWSIGDPESFRNSDAAEARALTRTQNESIFNNSWGPTDGVHWRDPIWGKPRGGTAATIAVGATIFDNVYVWAAGNGRQNGDNVNYDGYANSRFTIAVASVDQFGKQSEFSEPGASLLVSAPATGSFSPGVLSPPNAITTDLVIPGDNDVENNGDIGYNYHIGTDDPRGDPPFPPDQDSFPDVGYTNFGLWSAADPQGAFGGSSAAAPMVSGVVALIYDAYDDVNGTKPDPFMINPAGVISKLTYRDVQHILVNSTWQNDAGDQGDGEVGQPDGWATNRAGKKVSHKYGFGVIDAELAVKNARIWPGIGPQQVLDTGVINVLPAPTDPVGSVGRVIPNDGTQIGHVFNFDHRAGQLEDSCFELAPGGGEVLECSYNGVRLDPTDPSSFDPTSFPPLEYVELQIYTDHPNAGELEVILESPKAFPGASFGTISLMADQHASDQNYDSNNAWTFTSARHWGELPIGGNGISGDWILKIRDKATGNVGELLGYKLTFYGGEVNPTAVDDNVSGKSSLTQTIDVLGNDLGAIDPTTVTIVTGPNNGTLLVNAGTGAITYTNTDAATSAGTDTFTYQFTDRYGGTSNIATVTITLSPYNQSPVTFDRIANTAIDTPVVIDVIDGEAGNPDDDAFDPDGTIDRDGVVIQVVPYQVDNPFAPSPGTAEFITDAASPNYQMVVFTPAAGFEGRARFHYSVRDNQGLPSSPKTVDIEVGGAAILPPLAKDDNKKTNEQEAVLISILANDISSVPLDPTEVFITNAPTDPDIGTVVYDSNTGQVLFTPGRLAGEEVSFNYAVRDVNDALSNIATVTIDINRAPRVESPTITVTEDTPKTFRVNSSDQDEGPGFSPSELIIVSQPLHGVLSVDPVTLAITYLPFTDYVGEDGFYYFVKDSEGLRSPDGFVTLDVGPVNDAPVTVDDVARTAINTAVSIDVLANDTDVDDLLDPTSVEIQVGLGPYHGSVSVDPVSGEVVYTPHTGFAGGDTFSYFISDDDGATSNRGTVVVRVGDPVSSISGFVFVDNLESNGKKDPGEFAIREALVNVTVVGDGFSVTQSVRTDANGRFELIDSAATGLILPAGDYTISQVQPAFYADGLDSPGNASPTLIENDRFSGITLSPGDVISDIAFGEASVVSPFVPHLIPPLGTAQVAGLASVALDGDADTDPMGDSTPSNLYLEDGEVWLSFDELDAGNYRVIVTSHDGAVAATVYQNDILTIAGSSGVATDFAVFDFEATELPQYLMISGTGRDFDIQVIAIPSILPTSSPDLTIEADVLFKSSAWTAAFLGQTGMDDNGYEVPTGGASQFAPLPWFGMDEISIRFSEIVLGDIEMSDLSLRSTNGGEHAFDHFSYDVVSSTATWTLAEPLTNDKLIVDLSNMDRAIDFGGIAGTPDQLRVNISPGDVNQSGVSNMLDSLQIRRHIGTVVGDAGYSPKYDIDGSGAITAIDQILSYGYAFDSLPIPEPSPSVPSPSAAQSQAPAAIVTSVGVDSTVQAAAQRDPQASTIRTRITASPRLVDAALTELPLDVETDGNSVLGARRTVRRADAMSANSLDAVFETIK